MGSSGRATSGTCCGATPRQAGGHATPVALIREALQDFPGSQPLLRWLEAQTSAAERDTAALVVAQLSSLQEPVVPERLELVLEPLTRSRDDSFAQIAPALEGQIEVPRRSRLLTVLQQIAAGAASKVVERVAKGVTEALMGTIGSGP